MVYKWALKRTGLPKTKFAPHLSYMLYYEIIYTTDDKKLLSELRKNAMQLEDYFEFLTEDDIRLKGTRVGIETVLYDYIHRERSPEIIANTYPTITLEQVYATILYYLHNKEAISIYLADWLEWGREMRKRENANPSAARQRLSKLKAERLAQRKGIA
jgi:uncharacterized protein (DUF433 family)